MHTSYKLPHQFSALLESTEWALSPDKLIGFDLIPGDSIRGCHGLVWATVDGESADIMLAAGDVYKVPRHQRMRFNGFSNARMVILSRGRVANQRSLSSRKQVLRGWIGALVQRSPPY